MLAANSVTLHDVDGISAASVKRPGTSMRNVCNRSRTTARMALVSAAISMASTGAPIPSLAAFRDGTGDH